MDAITHPQKYNRRAASLVWVCIIVNMSILQGPTTFSWADNGVSPPPGLTPLPGEQPKPISVFVPLPQNELKKLNKAARSAVKKSPVRIKAVTDIHHANINAKLFDSLAARSITIGVSVTFQVSQQEGTGTSVTVVTDRVEQGSSGTLKWYGHVPGDQNSSVHLIVNEKERSLFGHIRIRRTVYEIRPTSSGAHTIYTLDPTRLPPDHLPDQHGRPSGLIEHSPAVAQPDHLIPGADSDGGEPVKLVARRHVLEGIPARPVDGILVGLPQIDVMVLYTQEAASQAVMGNISTEVCLAVDQMATSLADSGVQATVRLVHHGVTTLSQNNSIDLFLSDLTDPIKNANAHALRDQYGADAVSVWVSDSVGNGDECGKTHPQYPPDLNNAAAAYSVVLRSCAAHLERFSFAHELGHILGAYHDRFQDQAGTGMKSLQANWGYVNPDKGWRTMMAYNRDDCTLSYCNRLGLWSNPNVFHPLNGVDRTGRPTNIMPYDCTDRTVDPSTSGCDGPAYNKLTLDWAAGIVAQFRPQAKTLGNITCGSGGGDTSPPASPGGLHIF